MCPKISVYYEFPLLRRITENTKVANVIANEMYDLSTRAKFPGARFQSLLLIMSEIAAEIQLFTKKKWKKKNNFFSIQIMIGSFRGDFRNKTILSTTFELIFVHINKKLSSEVP